MNPRVLNVVQWHLEAALRNAAAHRFSQTHTRYRSWPSGRWLKGSPWPSLQWCGKCRRTLTRVSRAYALALALTENPPTEG